MKIIKIQGGLGNQMFQYAFAKSCAMHSGDDIYLDISNYTKNINNKKGIDSIHNGYELEHLFNIDLPEADMKSVLKLGTLPDSFLHRFKRKYLTKKTHYIEKGLQAVNLELLKSSKNLYLEGYWQSEDYFSECTDVIRQAFDFKLTPAQKNLDLLKEHKNLVSIHVRRGDYLNQTGFAVCTEDYYSAAIKYMKEKFTDSIFLIFSDDILWCKDFFKSLIDSDKCMFVDWNCGADSWQDMYLMSRCKGNIIANSTFSWWAAWLNNSSDKCVVAPKNWCTLPDFDVSRLVPDSWIRL